MLLRAPFSFCVWPRAHLFRAAADTTTQGSSERAYEQLLWDHRGGPAPSAVQNQSPPREIDPMAARAGSGFGKEAVSRTSRHGQNAAQICSVVPTFMSPKTNHFFLRKTGVCRLFIKKKLTSAGDPQKSGCPLPPKPAHAQWCLPMEAVLAQRPLGERRKGRGECTCVVWVI